MKAAQSRSNWVRHLFGAIGLTLTLGLAACGGGSTEENGTAAATKHALSAVVAPSVSVIAVTKVSETRVSRTVYDYVFKVTVLNGLVPHAAVVATLTAAGSGTTIIDGSVLVGDMSSGAAVTPSDTITLRQDRTFTFDAPGLVWNIVGTPDPNYAAVVVDAAGGRVATPSGVVQIDVPPGALSGPQTITIVPATPDEIGGYPIAGPIVKLGPDGLNFAVPVKITIQYDPTGLPQGMAASDLLIGYHVGDVSGAIQTTVDQNNHTLQGYTTHFSFWNPRGKITVPEYTRFGVTIPEWEWETTDPNLINGCWSVFNTAAKRQYFLDVEKVARAVFKERIPSTTDYFQYAGVGCVTEPYLKNWYSIETFERNENHAGIDFKSAGGDTAYAVLPGTVIRGGTTGTQSVLPGLDIGQKVSTLIIESDIDRQPYWIFYVHCSSHLGLAPGMPVAAGQAVCLTGSVGAGTDKAPAPHLHLEVKPKGADLAGTKGVVSPGRSQCGATIPGPNKTPVPGCSLAEVKIRTVDPTILVMAQSPLTCPHPAVPI